MRCPSAVSSCRGDRKRNFQSDSAHHNCIVLCGFANLLCLPPRPHLYGLCAAHPCIPLRLPGPGGVGGPKTYAAPAALHGAGGVAQPGAGAGAVGGVAAGALLPWKLVHAARLAEAGHLGRAAHYVASVQARPLSGPAAAPGGRRASAWQPEEMRQEITWLCLLRTSMSVLFWRVPTGVGGSTMAGCATVAACERARCCVTAARRPRLLSAAPFFGLRARAPSPKPNRLRLADGRRASCPPSSNAG